MVHTKKSNPVLNIAVLQEEMNETVFNYIDTTQNWRKAYERLDDILHQVAHYFNAVVEQKDGKLPQANTYWTLYMDLASRLVYFTGLAQSNLTDLKDEGAKENLLRMYRIASACLPNVQSEDQTAFFEEIEQSYYALSGVHDLVKHERTIIACIEQFAEFAKSYK